LQSKVRYVTRHEYPEVYYRHSSIFLTLALYGAEWLITRSVRFIPGKRIRSPFYRKLGGPQGRSGGVRKISPLPEFNSKTVQPVVQSLYRLHYGMYLQ